MQKSERRQEMARDETREEDRDRADEQPLEEGRELTVPTRENAQEQNGPVPTAWEPLGSGSRSRRRILWIAPLGVIGLLLAGLVIYLAVARGPTARTGTVQSIEQGALQISSKDDESWHPLEKGGSIPQGARIRSTTDTWATIALPDQSLMRIEAPGTWEVAELVGKDGRVRITVEQEQGRASFVSPPPRSFDRSRFRIRVAGATAELVGVGTFTTNEQGTQARILQGQCILWASDKATKVVAGQTATIHSNGAVDTESE